MPDGIRRGTAYMVGGLGMSMAAGLVVQVLLTRGLGPEAYGLYGLVVFNAALVSGVLGPGMSGAMGVLGAEHDAVKSIRKLTKLLKDGLLIQLLLSAALLLVVLWQAEEIAVRFFEQSSWLLYACLALAILHGFHGLFAGVLQGLRELKWLAISRVLERMSLLLFVLLLVIGVGSGVKGAILSQLLSVGFAIGLTMLLAKRFVNDRLKAETESQTDASESNYYGNIISFAVPVSVAAVAARLIQDSGPAALGYLFGTSLETQLGVVVLLLSLARMLDMVLKTVFRSAMPYMVNWRASGNTQKVRAYLSKMALLICLCYIAILMVSVLAGRFLVTLAFGEQYALAASYLPLVVVAYWVVSMQDVYRIVIFSMKAQGSFVVINLLGTALYLAVLVVSANSLAAPDPIALVFTANAVAHIVVLVGAIFLLNRVVFVQQSN